MDGLKTILLRYYQEHKTLFKGAVIVTIVIVAALFFTFRGEEDEFSEQFTDQTASAAASQSEDEEQTPAVSEIYVDISGQVKNPGVYQVPEGTRIFEVIEKAGGLTGDAWMDQVNQAEAVSDGQKIIIPEKSDAETSAGAAAQPGKNAQGLININTADSAVLQEIPGVGPATAEKILAYRTENGRFSSIEDIRNVSGIGEKTFEKMKDRITV